MSSFLLNSGGLGKLVRSSRLGTLATGSEVSLPELFYEFYSDVGAKKSVAGFAGPTNGEGAEFFDAAGLYVSADNVQYRVYSLVSGEVSSEFSSIVVPPITAALRAVALEWDGASGVTDYVVFRYCGERDTVWYYTVVNGATTLNDYGELSGAWAVGDPVSPAPYPTDDSAYAAAAVGELVSKHEDQSGNARHRTQATSALRPSANNDEPLNAHNPILFNIGHELISATWSGQSAFTVFLLILPGSATEEQIGPLGVSEFDGLRLMDNTSGQWFMARAPGVTDPDPADPGTVVLVTAVFAGAASKLRINGVEKATGTVAVNAVLSFLRGGLFYYYHDRAYAAALSPAQCVLVEAEIETHYGL